MVDNGYGGGFRIDLFVEIQRYRASVGSAEDWGALLFLEAAASG